MILSDWGCRKGPGLRHLPGLGRGREERQTAAMSEDLQSLQGHERANGERLTEKYSEDREEGKRSVGE